MVTHTGVVQVVVGDAPIRSEADIRELCKQLIEQLEHSQTKGVYKAAEHRQRFVKLFEQAQEHLEE